MISLTCARELGQLRVAQHHLGAISARHGARRVNTLSTRARRRIVLFTSMTADDVPPGSGGGVQALADYLRYVEGRQAQVEVQAEAAEPVAPADACRHEIAARLEANGFSVDLGAFGFDLAVRHPRDPGLYLAGIASDGPGFAAVRSARERDRLRDEVLSAKGWTVLRAWSADWFASPQGQTAKLVEDLTRLAASPIGADRAPPQKPATASAAAVPIAPSPAGGGEPAAKPFTTQGASP
jgi:hypothetical protein